MVLRFVFYTYFTVLAALFVLGAVRYKMLDKGSKLIFYLVCLSLLCESVTAITFDLPYFKMPTYHVYNVLQLMVITWYFLHTVHLRNKVLYIFSCVLYVGIEIGNDILYQPLRKFNSNFIIFECLLIIPMALYALYKILVNDDIEKMNRYVHFWFWTFLLVFFSSSFFFWPFVVYFYKHSQLYYNISSYTHLIVNLIVYAGIFVTFLKYPKMIRNEY